MPTPAVTPQPGPTRAAADVPPLRIRLGSSLGDGFSSGPLDGAWWPRSRNLEREVADLVDHFPHDQGEIARVLFARPDWDGQSPGHSDHTVRCARGLVNVGSFPHDDTHRVVLLLRRTQKRVTLLVIPSDTSEHVAQHLMAQASDDLNTRSAAELLAEMALEPDPMLVWESEGGHPSQ